MKIVALSKTFDGNEFAEASIEAIYPFIDKLVIVNSNISWAGKEGNTVRPVIENWAGKHDNKNKIIQINGSFRDQKDQYQVGVDFIYKKLKHDLVMLMDMDEVWDHHHLDKALRYIEKSDHHTYATTYRTYMKTPFYYVYPLFGDPTVFVRNVQNVMRGPRGFTKDKHFIEGVYFHHYTGVRRTMQDVLDKIQTSWLGDGETGSVPELDEWVDRIWNRMPNVENLHYFPEYREVWKSIRTVGFNDIPKTVVGKPIYNTFVLASSQANGHIDVGEIEVLRKMSQDKALCVDLGTGCGQSAIALSLGKGRVVTIDPFEGEIEVEEVKKRLDWYSNIEMVQSPTCKPPSSCYNVDLLFIGGDDNYERIVIDFNSWWSRIKQGGVIVFHNNSDLHPGVQRIMKDLDSSTKLMRQKHKEIGSLAVFEKNVR